MAHTHAAHTPHASEGGGMKAASFRGGAPFGEEIGLMAPHHAAHIPHVSAGACRHSAEIWRP